MNCVHTKTCPWLFILGFFFFFAFFFANSQNLELQKCPTIMGEWLNKLRYIHTIKYYSAIKRNGLSIHTTVWMDLKGIMLSGKKLISKEWHTRWFHLYNMFAMTTLKRRKTDSWLPGVRGSERKDVEWLERNGTREMMTVQFCILTAVVVTWISSHDKMTWTYTHTLHQCYLPGFDTVL